MSLGLQVLLLRYPSRLQAHSSPPYVNDLVILLGQILLKTVLKHFEMWA